MAGTQYALAPGGETRPIPAKIANLRLRRGDTFVLVSSGGGGLGDPRMRDPAAVSRDVAEGYVSTDVARRVYGALLR